jgi:hypothetical protein
LAEPERDDHQDYPDAQGDADATPAPITASTPENRPGAELICGQDHARNRGSRPDGPPILLTEAIAALLQAGASDGTLQRHTLTQEPNGPRHEETPAYGPFSLVVAGDGFEPSKA